MRNLKRVLSLALAMVMILGMMVMGVSAASADFPDAAEIDYTEAVDVISGLGIMTGDEKGSFNPDQVLTREQAAKIICYVLIGAENAEKLGTNTQIFTDVAAGRWSAGYIAYCANLGILVGDGNGMFRPEDQLTGVQFGKMLLVAAGYNAEVEGYLGADWATNIATDMIDNGLDVKGVIMSDELTREQAAQMLLQAMDVNTVTYATGNVVGMIGPFDAEQTFAEKYFPKLEKIEGVVTANEYADLYGDTPLKAGRTEIDGKTYTGATELTDIGESRVGWANNGTILYLADSGKNVVFETGAATDINTTTKFKKVTGLSKTEDTESFLNFDGSDQYTSDYRIKYVLTFADADAVTDFEEDLGVDLSELMGGNAGSTAFTKTIKAEATITADDLKVIKEIFYIADLVEDEDNDKYDYVVGEVYVGTTSKTDVSDEISYKTFYSEYIDEDGTTASVTESVNGEWLKVIDNNGDGDADYVLKTEFAMAEIENITKKGVYTLAELENDDEPSFNIATINTATDTIVTSDELAAGDIVLYTVIDGVYYIDIAEIVTEEIDKKGIDTKNETITCGDNVYGQSHIGYADVTGYDADITDAATQVSYDLYLDHFDYVRLYTPTGYNNGFVLLTDGYYYTDGRTEEFQATIFDAEAEELTDVDVAVGAAKNSTYAGTFIDITEGGDNGNRGTWGRLEDVNDVYFFGTSGKSYITDIAAFSASEDVYTLTEAGNASNKVIYEVHELTDIDVDKALSAKTLSGKLYTESAGTVTAADTTIQTTTDTVYYLVVKTAKNTVSEVITWTGYANAPKTAALAADTVGYAVTSGTGQLYDVAEVVVFESYAADPYDLYFTYNYAGKLTNTNGFDAITIGYDAEDEVYTSDLYVDASQKYGDNLVMPGFATISANGVIDNITEKFYNEDIYAGTVRVAQKVSSRDYVVVQDTYIGEISFKPASTPCYVLTYNAKTGYGVAEQDEAFAVGEKLIVVTDGSKSQNVLYVINVDQSVYNKAVIDALYAMAANGTESGLYQDIVNDAKPVTNATAAPTILDPNGDPITFDANNKASFAYATWKNWTGKNYTVEPAAGNKIAVNGKSTFTTADVSVAVSTGSTQKITVMTQGDAAGAVTETYTFEITYNDGDDGADLKYDGAAVDTISNYDGKATTIPNLKALYTGGVKRDWTFYDGNGNLIADEADLHDTAALGLAEVVVTSETGVTKSYVVYFASEEDMDADLVPAAVEALLKDDSLTLKDIAGAIWTDNNQNGDAVIIPAMVDAGVTAEELYEEYGKDPDVIAGILAENTDMDAAQIAKAYVNYWAGCENPKGLSNIEVAYKDGVLDVAVKSGASASNTDLFDVANAAGIQTSDIKLSWKDQEGGTATDKGVSDFASQWNEMLNNVLNNNYSYTITVAAKGETITVNLAKAAE